MDSTRYSFTAYKRDGSVIVVDAHGRRIEYQGRPAIIGTLMDITEMRRSKEELKRLVEEQSGKLRQSEELLRTLIEAIPDSIKFKDGEGRWLESNPSAREAFGLAHVDCRGKTDRELAEMVDAAYRSACCAAMKRTKQAWRTDGVSRVEEIFPLPDGRERYFDVIKKPLFGADGGRKGLVIIGRDISELKLAEAELRVTASVFDNSQEAIVITDADNVIVDVNPAFTLITGYGRERGIGPESKDAEFGKTGQGVLRCNVGVAET